MRKLLVSLCLAGALAGCAPSPIPRPVCDQVAVVPSAGELANAVWTATPRVLRLRQTARFEFRGRTVPMIGMMELDTRNQRARLVAVNELGVKLFVLEVTAASVNEHYLLPELSRYPRFSEAVAISLRRIFLLPRLQETGAVVLDAECAFQISAGHARERTTFHFKGAPLHLVKQGVSDGQDDWQVDYGDYRQTSTIEYPQAIVLADRQAGYRLELHITDCEVKP